jgi:hypothetical protein
VKGRVDTTKPVRVELCTGSVGWSQGAGGAKFYGNTPCEGNPFRFSAMTDKEGRFVFKNVPPYAMSLVVDRGAGQWANRQPECCWNVKPDAVVDVGTVTP